MVYYLVKMPTDLETKISRELLEFKLESFSEWGRCLLFDGGNENEVRFLLLIDKEGEEVKKALDEMEKIFGKDVTADILDIDKVDKSLLEKIKVAKLLSKNSDSYVGKKRAIFTTENSSQIFERAVNEFGNTGFTEFLSGYTDFIDRTSGISEKSIYNIVLINNNGMNLDSHIEFLFETLAAKGLIIDHTLFKGDRDDFKRTYRETRHVYVIEDEWKYDEDNDDYCSSTPEDRLLSAIFGVGDVSEASYRSKLLIKIKESNNIVITSMSQEDYDRLSKLALFPVAFSHVVTIDELTINDKLKTISRIAGEYGFSVAEKGFSENIFIKTAPTYKIEVAIRKTVQDKLLKNDNAFIIGAEDLVIDAECLEKSVSALDELENLIGLSGVKKTVKEIVKLLERRGKKAVPCLHMTFLGNPGTGKTTVARIVARLFKEVGLIEKDLLIETQRGGLIGKYLGHTAQKTAAVVKSAFGGVLFIDEAYALIERDDDCYGKEAISTLVKLMEDRRDEFVCILAGYTDGMNSMLDVNPGLRDRIQFHIEFPDYSLLELMQIFEQFCTKNSYETSDSARSALKNVLKNTVVEFRNLDKMKFCIPSEFSDDAIFEGSRDYDDASKIKSFVRSCRFISDGTGYPKSTEEGMFGGKLLRAYSVFKGSIAIEGSEFNNLRDSLGICYEIKDSKFTNCVNLSIKRDSLDEFLELTNCRFESCKENLACDSPLRIINCHFENISVDNSVAMAKYKILENCPDRWPFPPVTSFIEFFVPSGAETNRLENCFFDGVTLRNGSFLFKCNSFHRDSSEGKIVAVIKSCEFKNLATDNKSNEVVDFFGEGARRLEISDSKGFDSVRSIN